MTPPVNADPRRAPAADAITVANVASTSPRLHITRSSRFVLGGGAIRVKTSGQRLLHQQCHRSAEEQPPAERTPPARNTVAALSVERDGGFVALRHPERDTALARQARDHVAFVQQRTSDALTAMDRADGEFLDIRRIGCQSRIGDKSQHDRTPQCASPPDGLGERTDPARAGLLPQCKACGANDRPVNLGHDVPDGTSRQIPIDERGDRAGAAITERRRDLVGQALRDQPADQIGVGEGRRANADGRG